MLNTFDQNGFTLIEMMVVIIIISIISAIAIPSFKKQLVNQRLEDASNIFDSAIKDAKSQALISQRAVKIVFKNKDSNIDKSLNVLYVRKDTSSTDEMISQYMLDKKLKIATVPTTLDSLTITPKQAVFEGEDMTGTRVTDHNLEISFCQGVEGSDRYEESDKYKVIVGNRGNVEVKKDGSCQ